MKDFLKFRVNINLYDNLTTEQEINDIKIIFSLFQEWNDFTSGTLPPKGDLRLKPINHGNEKALPGAWLYKFNNSNIINSIEGIDDLDHYVKKDVDWLNTVIDTKDILDESDQVIETINITNKDKYQVSDSLINDTHCLVKLTDSNFTDFSSELTFDSIGSSTNFFCNDRFKEEYDLNFKVEPIEEV